MKLSELKLSSTGRAVYNTDGDFVFMSDRRIETLQILKACQFHDQLVSALSGLVEQVESLESRELTRDLEPYKAEACWDDSIGTARALLTRVNA